MRRIIGSTRRSRASTRSRLTTSTRRDAADDHVRRTTARRILAVGDRDRGRTGRSSSTNLRGHGEGPRPLYFDIGNGDIADRMHGSIETSPAAVRRPISRKATRDVATFADVAARAGAPAVTCPERRERFSRAGRQPSGAVDAHRSRVHHRAREQGLRRRSSAIFRARTAIRRTRSKTRSPARWTVSGTTCARSRARSR